MNERIRELAEQAVCEVDNVDLDSPLQEELAKMYIPDCFVEKFAELIVLKCAEIADTAEPYKSADLMKQYFGIK